MADQQDPEQFDQGAPRIIDKRQEKRDAAAAARLAAETAASQLADEIPIGLPEGMTAEDLLARQATAMNDEPAEDARDRPYLTAFTVYLDHVGRAFAAPLGVIQPEQCTREPSDVDYLNACHYVLNEIQISSTIAGVLGALSGVGRRVAQAQQTAVPRR